MVKSDWFGNFRKSKKKPNDGQMKKMFLEIWEEREHVSELSGKQLLPLGHFQWHWMFLHVLPHGSYPKYKFNKENIILALPEEHDRQETFFAFQEKKDILRQKYYEEFYGKEY